MPLKNARKTAMCGLSLLCLWSASSPSPTFSAEFPAKYDGQIKAAVVKWWPDLPDWRLLKAQYWQESRLDPTAKSGVGAEGVAQFMAPTWIDVIRALNWPKTVSRRDAAFAIEGGAYFQMKQRTAWQPTGRTAYDRNDLGLAAYNAGLGNVLKAQKRCQDARLWPGISPCLKDVTGEYAAETLTYIDRIHKWRRMME